MRIRLERSGGFAAIPALNTAVDVDTTTLSGDEAAEIEGLVSQVEEAAPSAAEPHPASADLREYVLTIEDGTSRSLTLRDPLTSRASALVRRLNSHRRKDSS